MIFYDIQSTFINHAFSVQLISTQFFLMINFTDIPIKVIRKIFFSAENVDI